MKLTEERRKFLRNVLPSAEYCHLGQWGGGQWEVQQDLEDALDDLAQLEAEVERLRKHVKSAEEIIRKIPEEMFEDIIDEFYTALKARDD